MDLFEGISKQHVGQIRKLRNYQVFQADKPIFSMGDAAECMYVILEGSVEIFIGEGEERRIIAEYKQGDVFGEMGILLGDTRKASARSVSATVLLEIPRDAVEWIMETVPPEGSLRLMENLISILGERLTRSNQAESVRGVDLGAYTDEQKRAVEVFERNMPKGLKLLFGSKKTLAANQFLCSEGEEPKELYFITKGTLSVIKRQSGGDKAISEITAPAVAGTVGFFAGSKRNASLKVKEPITYTTFNRQQFEELRERDPREAGMMLFAAAQLIVFLTLQGR